ncbi:hypothetical protein CR513_58188, partial [Mucuna pruriens]
MANGIALYDRHLRTHTFTHTYLGYFKFGRFTQIMGIDKANDHTLFIKHSQGDELIVINPKQRHGGQPQNR